MIATTAPTYAYSRDTSAQRGKGPEAGRIKLDARDKFKILTVDDLDIEFLITAGDEVEAKVRVLADREVYIGAEHELAPVTYFNTAHEMRGCISACQLIHRQTRIVRMADH